MVLHALILALRGFRTENLRVMTVTQWNHVSNKQTKQELKIRLEFPTENDITPHPRIKL